MYRRNKSFLPLCFPHAFKVQQSFYVSKDPCMLILQFTARTPPAGTEPLSVSPLLHCSLAWNDFPFLYLDNSLGQLPNDVLKQQNHLRGCESHMSAKGTRELLEGIKVLYTVYMFHILNFDCSSRYLAIYTS